MKHLFTKILLAMLMGMVGTNVLAYDVAEKNAAGITIYYNYINNGTELEVVGGFDGIFYAGKIVVPEKVAGLSVTALGNAAFAYSNDLISVIIPSSVTSIGLMAFSFCSKLEDIYCYAETAPEINSMAFEDSQQQGITLHVPKDFVSAYEDESSWNGFKDIVPIIIGDANKDGYVNGYDICDIVNYVMDEETDNDFSFDNADVKVDNQINAADIVLLINKINGTKFYLIGDHNSWDMTDKTYAFTKLDDGKTWEITIPSEGAGCFKIAPGSAYDHQDGTFWSYLLCAEYDQHTGLHGIMQQGDIMAAWLLNTEGATSYTIRIVPSEMTYQIIPQ